MKTLTEDECSRWLVNHQIEEDPYGRLPYQAPWCNQFPIDTRPSRSSHICRRIVEIAEPFSKALLHITDWSLYQPDEMAVVSALRAAHDEQRWLINSPGHLFDASERDLLIGILSLVVFYGWTAYLYFDHRTTFLCWEGELLDLWTFEQSHAVTVAEIFEPRKSS